eukprot:scaffold44360_cov58-Phaeocystis_antarctica.AAC.1
MSAEALECPVCLTLPEGEVHQCNEGHCYCAACWNRLEEPRRCPECRQLVPQANRSRAAERAIAALEWSCEHCGEATTRGAKAAHLAACPQVPTACAAAAAGCGWAGMMSEQAAHDLACPFAICQRMLAPLQAECLELRARVTPLQAQNQQMRSESQELRTRCDGLQAQNQQLQQQVTALQPLAGRVRALEGVETEEGGRRQRQRVGPAPHDASPSNAAIATMGLAEAVAALRAHMADARVAEKACNRLGSLSRTNRREQAATEAGMVEAVVEATRAHPLVAGVQEQGCLALAFVCCGFDAAAGARRQRAADAGAIEAAVNALRAHPQELNVQKWACRALAKVCVGDDAAGLARSQRAAEAGAIEAAVAAMRAHPQAADVQEEGCRALANLCQGTDAAARSRSQRAAVAGALEEVLVAMRAHPQVVLVQAKGGEALLNVCGGGASAAARARRRRATQAGGRVAVAAAMQAHPGEGGVFCQEVQRHGQLLLDALPE